MPHPSSHLNRETVQRELSQSLNKLAGELDYSTELDPNQNIESFFGNIMQHVYKEKSDLLLNEKIADLFADLESAYEQFGLKNIAAQKIISNLTNQLSQELSLIHI